MGNATRAMMQHAKLPRNYAWYALRQSVAVRNTLPISSDPDACPHSRFTGSKPSASQFRVWGCVAYAKVYDRVTKMANQAVRCVHLGRAPNQSGYLCYEPRTRTMHVSTHVRFVETALPGLTMHSSGWEEVVPDFDFDFEPTATRAPEGEFTDEHTCHISDWISILKISNLYSPLPIRRVSTV